MGKSYTWKEIKEVLVDELKETKHIMTFGTIGSCNVGNDVDIVVTKNPKSKSSDFYRELHNLFDSMNKYLHEEYESKLIRIHGLSFQGEMLNHIEIDDDDLILHTLVYVSFSQIKNEWKPWSDEDENVTDLLKNNYSCLLGNKNDLFDEKFSRKKYYDFMFTYLSHYDRINFPYSEKMLVIVMNKFYSYLFKKRLGLDVPVAKDKKQARNIFYELCDVLDDLERYKNAEKIS